MQLIHCAETIKGGIATYLRELLPLQRAAYGDTNITLVLPADQRDQLSAGVLGGVTVVWFKPFRTRALRSLALAVVLWPVIEAKPRAVLHIHSSFAGVVARVVAKFGRTSGRVVYCAHGWAFDRAENSTMSGRSGVYARIERGLANWCDAIVCISSHEYELAIRANLPAQRLALVRNALAGVGPDPVKMSVPLPWRQGRMKLLFLGRLDRQKGVDILAEAMFTLQDHADCAVVGEGVLFDTKVESWPTNMLRLGWCDAGQIEWLLTQCNAVVMPSRWEGFGLVALEAMRAGKPVIASSVGGLQEIIEHGVTGVLVPPNQPNALAAAIRTLSVNDAAVMGSAGKSKFHRCYVSERLFAELHSVYCDERTVEI